MERVKKIVFAVSNDLSYDQRMQRICSTLAEAGYDVTIVGRNRKSSKPLATQRFSQHRLNMWFDKGKLFYIELNLRLFFYLLTKPFDAVCGIDLDTAVPCWTVAKLKSKTFVYDAHELFTEVPEVINRPGVYRFWKNIERFVVARVKHFYTVSESVAEEFVRRYGVRPDVIRNLPMRGHLSSGLVEVSHQTLVYRGAVNAGRGVEQTIEALKLLPNMKLIVAGDGDVLDDAKECAKKFGLENRVTFTGYATPDELNRYTKSAWLGLNLLDGSSANYRFSLANKFFDYIQCGVPQITMRFPEYERINQQYNVAILVDDLQPETIANAVNNLVANEHRYTELKLNCAKAAVDLCWENERNKLLDFYRNLP